MTGASGLTSCPLSFSDIRAPLLPVLDAVAILLETLFLFGQVFVVIEHHHLDQAVQTVALPFLRKFAEARFTTDREQRLRGYTAGLFYLLASQRGWYAKKQRLSRTVERNSSRRIQHTPRERTEKDREQNRENPKDVGPWAEQQSSKVEGVVGCVKLGTEQPSWFSPTCRSCQVEVLTSRFCMVSPGVRQTWVAIDRDSSPTELEWCCVFLAHYLVLRSIAA